MEGLLGAVWDTDFAWGILNEQAPDPDMPRATADKSHGNTLYAMLADIRTAWQRCYLEPGVRQALVLCGRFSCTQREAAKLVGCSQPTMQARWDEGIGRLMHWLNGTEYEYDETET